MIGLDDQITEFRELCASNGACAESLVWLDQCISEQMTMRGMIEAMQENWGVWARNAMPYLLSPEVRFAFSEHATRDDPRMAAHFQIYAEGITVEENAMLASRWSAEQLPNIARQLEEGVVTLAIDRQ